MKIILLSGGSGKRLWPLSNDVRSKQFLKVVRGGDGKAGDGNGKNSKAQTCAKGVRPGERTKKLLIFGRSDRAFVQNPQIPVEFLRVPADFFMIFMNCFPESDLL